MRHTLQLKLLIIGIICLLLTGGSSAVQLLQFRDIGRASDHVQARYDVATGDSSRLREEMIRLVARVKDVWLRGGKTDSVDSVADTAEQSWQTIATLRNQLDSDLDLTDAMRARLQQYDDAIADYRSSYVRALAQYRLELMQPDAANADTRADNELKGKGLVASGLLGGFQDEIRAATARMRADRRASIDTARNVMLAETAILLLFLAGVGFWLVRSIGQGIGGVALATAAFGRGARDVHVPVRGNGEIAQLGTAFNAMVRELASQEQQLEELRRIAVALTSATTEREVCEIVVNRLAESFGYQYVSIYLLRPGDPDNLHLVSQHGYRTVIDPISVRGTVTGRAVRERRSILIADSRHEDDFLAAEAQIVCEACAPLLTPDRVLGTLLLEEDIVDKLSEPDLNLITTLANNVSVALENVRLNVEARSRLASLTSANRELAAVTATGTRLAATLELDAVFSLVAEEVGRVVDAPLLYVASYDEAQREVIVQVGIIAGERIFPARVSPETTLSGWLIRTRRSILLSSQDDIDRFVDEAGLQPGDAHPASIFGVPLIAGADVVGAVWLGSPEPNAFTEQQISVIQTIAAQAAIAVKNALLYDQVQQQVIEMQRLNTELESANALKSEFLATMSHELRTPLNAIIGFSELLADGIVTEADEVGACLTDILNSGRHLLGLINDVLDISKIEAGRMELKRVAFDIRDEVQEVTRSVSPLIAARRHTLEIDAPLHPVTVFADRQRIRQIILNLVSNAIKFTPDGGTIHIGVAHEPATPEHARLWVRDTGIGIRAEDFSKLFEKFRQLDSSHNRRYEGTGLGLALTKQLVELNGGAIIVESRYGAGSTFAFTVPLALPLLAETPVDAPVIAATG